MLGWGHNHLKSHAKLCFYAEKATSNLLKTEITASCHPIIKAKRSNLYFHSEEKKKNNTFWLIIYIQVSRMTLRPNLFYLKTFDLIGILLHCTSVKLNIKAPNVLATEFFFQPSQITRICSSK